jgi:hypothetical protein
MNPFKPTANTVSISVGAASANVQIDASVSVWRQIRIMNNGSATAWIRFGTDNTVAATTAADIPIGPGTCEVMTVHATPIWVAAIAAGATGSIYFTPGAGI